MAAPTKKVWSVGTLSITYSVTLGLTTTLGGNSRRLSNSRGFTGGYALEDLYLEVHGPAVGAEVVTAGQAPKAVPRRILEADGALDRQAVADRLQTRAGRERVVAHPTSPVVIAAGPFQMCETVKVAALVVYSLVPL